MHDYKINETTSYRQILSDLNDLNSFQYIVKSCSEKLIKSTEVKIFIQILEGNANCGEIFIYSSIF